MRHDMRLLFLLLAWFLLTAASFTDSFTRADSSDIGANWSSGYTDRDPMNLVLEVIRATNFDVDAVESVNSFSPANDQYSQIQIATLPADDHGGVEVYTFTRMATPATVTMYFCSANKFHGSGTTTLLAKFVAGTFTELASESTTTWAVSDVLKTTSQSTTHKCFQNAGQILSSTDNAIASGRVGAGLTVKNTGGQEIHVLEADNFEGGDIAGLAVVRRRRPIILQ
jgi:hypothetical protein